MSQHSSYAAEFGEMELVPGTLRGYRGWRWNEDTQRLMSTGWMHDWAPERLQPDAMCLRPDGEAWDFHAASLDDYRLHFMMQSFPPIVRRSGAPVPQCTCGYYASYAPRAYIDHGWLWSRDYLHGTVSAHGAVVLGTRGFRAQRVELDALWGRGANKVAAEAYGVPWFATEREMLQEFPPSNVDELLGRDLKTVEPQDPPLYDEFTNLGSFGSANLEP
jgi:hypothetical protein